MPRDSSGPQGIREISNGIMILCYAISSPRHHSCCRQWSNSLVYGSGFMDHGLCFMAHGAYIDDGTCNRTNNRTNNRHVISDCSEHSLASERAFPGALVSERAFRRYIQLYTLTSSFFAFSLQLKKVIEKIRKIIESANRLLNMNQKCTPCIFPKKIHAS